MRVLGIIPARGGSKGVKDKNIRIVAGQPLIQYAIDACKSSKKITKYVVSTDSRKIAEISRKLGAQVIERPDYLATDTSPVVDAALYTLRLMEQSDAIYDAILLVQPTSPIRSSEDIDRAIELLETSLEIDGVISVVQVNDNHPARMYEMTRKNRISSLQPEFENSRRQDLPNYFHRNGAIYLVRREQLVINKTFMPAIKAGLIMGSDFQINIDNELDIIIAEAVINAWKNNQP